MAGPDRHGRGRRGARRVQEAPHAVIRRIYAATVTPRVFQVWEVSGDREYRICRVYSGTVYNRCIIKYMPVLCQYYGSDTRAGSGFRGAEDRGSAQSHASRAARASPPATAIARTGLRSAARPVRRCDREVRGPVRPRGRGLWRSVPAVRPPAGRGGRRAGVRGRTRQPDETGQPARDGHGGAGCAAARSVSPVFWRPRPRGPNAGATP